MIITIQPTDNRLIIEATEITEAQSDRFVSIVRSFENSEKNAQSVISPKQVVDAGMQFFNVQREQIGRGKRNPDGMDAKRIICYCIEKYCKRYSGNEQEKATGWDRCTIIHHARKAFEFSNIYPEFADKLNNFYEFLKNVTNEGT